ncbi:MAG: hypothetical protein QY326_08980 [Bdellovibrionota bacterium]|nr:MAG: hypothetical protein QY326_08980 [Bdellovibrionota bacterium]
MKRTLFLFASSLLIAGPALAEEPIDPSEYDDHPAVENNLGAMGSQDAAAVIAQETGGASGAANGEITIHYDGSNIRVYSGLNKVELIPTGADGWSGAYTVQTNAIMFQPTGRPQLECPEQSTAGWYGPCKIPQLD